MKTGIKVPSLGESVVEARIAHWLKKEGDVVAVGDTLVELETEKVNVDITAEADGILSKILIREDETVHIGDTIGEIDSDGTGQKKLESGEREARGQGKEVGAPEVENMRSWKDERNGTETQKSEARSKMGTMGDTERVTPVAKKVAEATGVQISGVAGSGVGGRITKHDVEEVIQRKGKEVGETETGSRRQEPGKNGSGGTKFVDADNGAGGRVGREERVRMSLRRKTIARRMVEAQQAAAMLTTFNEIDMSRVMELRKNYKEEFRAKYGVNLGIVSFFVKAVIAALRDFPRLNAEINGDDIVFKYYYDIGVAIGAEEGLVVPVLRNAETMSFAEIENAIKSFAEKSSSGKLTLEDLRGGTFTITNGGVFGSMMSTPILNPPQVGILGLHKIYERPVVIEGQVVVKPMMYVALTYDHRIVDGRESVQFLVKVKDYIEDPASMLLG